ncbi:MAG: hypothetical protein QW197_03555 [Candidatus Aenigmatarchaeota archaeon]
MAQRKATITIKNIGNIQAYINLGFGLASATFDPKTQGFPRPPYLGDIIDFGGNPPDIRNIYLSPGESKTFTVTFYDDKLIGKYSTAYFVVAVWDASTGFTKILAYKFASFNVTSPPPQVLEFEITVTIS